MPVQPRRSDEIRMDETGELVHSVADGRSLPFDLSYLSDFLLDAVIRPEYVTWKDETLRIEMGRERWEVEDGKGRARPVRSRLELTPVESLHWLVSDRRLRAPPGGFLLQSPLVVHRVVLAPIDQCAGHDQGLVLWSEEVELRIALGAGWQARLRDI